MSSMLFQGFVLLVLLVTSVMAETAAAFSNRSRLARILAKGVLSSKGVSIERDAGNIFLCVNTV